MRRVRTRLHTSSPPSNVCADAVFGQLPRCDLCFRGGTTALWICFSRSIKYTFPPEGCGEDPGPVCSAIRLARPAAAGSRDRPRAALTLPGYNILVHRLQSTECGMQNALGYTCTALQ